MLSDATMRFGEDLTVALLGLDALYGAERGKSAPTNGGDIERLVVLNMSTTHQPARFGDYDEAAARFTELREQAGGLPEADHRLYYTQTCDSAIAFATWRSRGLAFSDQISRFLHVPPHPAGDDELDRLRSEMRGVLTELGYAGDLKEQCAAWEARHRVAPGEVNALLTDLLSEAWDRTADIVEIPAPKSDGMKVETVSDVPYNAMCDYSHRVIRLNIDPVLTLPGLRHLAITRGILVIMSSSADARSAISAASHRPMGYFPSSTPPVHLRSRASPISGWRSLAGPVRSMTGFRN